MNNQATIVLNPVQKLKLDLWREFKYEAPSVFEFITCDDQQVPSGDQDHRKYIPDGVYYVFANGSYTLFDESQSGEPVDCIGIGVKQGEHTFMVALNDAADGDDVRLTSKEDNTSGFAYKPRECDALYDWDGEANTDHLKQIGLNPEIKLNDGEYIPPLAQLVAIARNIDAINAALAKIPFADEIAETRYWSSTETSATHAWSVGFTTGFVNNLAKATSSARVRPVAAFQI